VRLSDETYIEAKIKGDKFFVTTTGIRDSIIEVAQQFAWLGTALRLSPLETGIALYRPFLTSEARSSEPGIDMFCKIDFTMIGSSISERTLPGQCWHDMFRNPVMATGFPISMKHKHALGIEMPLNMMAELVGSHRVIEFHGSVYIKGFSTMLVATMLEANLLTWHYVFKTNGERISYLDSALEDAFEVNLLQSDRIRHVVGWSPHCRYYAGTCLEHVFTCTYLTRFARCCRCPVQHQRH
jgi:hypothetical protein